MEDFKFLAGCQKWMAVKDGPRTVLAQGRKPKSLCPMLRVSILKELTSMKNAATLNTRPAANNKSAY
jgi:hypothetical protein